MPTLIVNASLALMVSDALLLFFGAIVLVVLGLLLAEFVAERSWWISRSGGGGAWAKWLGRSLAQIHLHNGGSDEIFDWNEFDTAGRTSERYTGQH